MSQFQGWLGTNLRGWEKKRQPPATLPIQPTLKQQPLSIKNVQAIIIPYTSILSVTNATTKNPHLHRHHLNEYHPQHQNDEVPASNTIESSKEISSAPTKTIANASPKSVSKNSSTNSANMTNNSSPSNKKPNNNANIHPYRVPHPTSLTMSQRQKHHAATSPPSHKRMNHATHPHDDRHE